MKKILTTASLILLALTTQGCGDKKDGIDSPVEAAKYQAQYPELMKNWTSQDCIKSKILLVSPIHYKVEYDFFGDAFVKRYNYYSDSDCKDLSARITYKGNTTITEATDDGIGSRHLDMLFTGVSVASVTDGGRIFLETIDFCGQTKFPAGQEVDITATSSQPDCILQSSNQNPTFDRFIVSDGVLLLGTGFNEKSLNNTVADRPEVINDEHFITR